MSTSAGTAFNRWLVLQSNGPLSKNIIIIIIFFLLEIIMCWTGPRFEQMHSSVHGFVLLLVKQNL